MTIILGLMGVYHLICRIRHETNKFEDRIRLFAQTHRLELNLWGEIAMPYLLLHGMYLELTEGSNMAEALWGTLLRSLVERNKFKKEDEKDFALSDPYLEIEESLSYSFGVDQIPEWERIDYHGRAYSLRTLVLMLARRWRRQLLMSNWYGITGTDFIEMYPRPIWGMLLWRSETGDLRTTLPKRPQSWSELVRESTTADTNEIPSRLLSRPDFLAAMLTVYPHRLRADTVKVIDDAL